MPLTYVKRAVKGLLHTNSTVVDQTDPAEVFEVGERANDDLAESAVLAVTDHVRQVDGHDGVDRVDADEERVCRQQVVNETVLKHLSETQLRHSFFTRQNLYHVHNTRSPATAKSTARPSCLVGVLYDISAGEIC